MTKTFALAFGLLLCVPMAATANPFGLVCETTLPGQKMQTIHFSLDPDLAKYTARIGNQVIKSQQSFELERSYGANFQPTVVAAKLVFPTIGGFYFVRITAQNQLSVTSLNGSQSMAAGVCRDDEFKGL